MRKGNGKRKPKNASNPNEPPCPPEERAGWDEADRAVFERWQDEANTNAILDGYEPEEGEALTSTRSERTTDKGIRIWNESS